MVMSSTLIYQSHKNATISTTKINSLTHRRRKGEQGMGEGTTLIQGVGRPARARTAASSTTGGTAMPMIVATPAICWL